MEHVWALVQWEPQEKAVDSELRAAAMAWDEVVASDGAEAALAAAPEAIVSDEEEMRRASFLRLILPMLAVVVIIFQIIMEPMLSARLFVAVECIQIQIVRRGLHNGVPYAMIEGETSCTVKSLWRNC